MSLSIVKRPQDFYLSGSASTNTVIGTGDALINSGGHGLSTGFYIYITVGPTQMLGFWYVEILDANSFYIREYATASRVQTYLTTDSVTYYRAIPTTFTFLSVHNPIVYKLTSTLWPVNGVDTARAVSSFANLNGYTALTLSGTLHTGSTVLEKVIVSGTSSLDGVYTIIRWISASSIVIDLPYSASNSFSGGTVQYYYNNYHARIRIYSGLSPTVTTEVNKPIELIAELRVLPDTSGVIVINVAEIVKQKINIINNDSSKQALPNFYDAWTAHYIDYAESYDDSNGYTVEEIVSSYTSDSANRIYATNGKLPFKNREFGFSLYTTHVGVPFLAKWMTQFEEPVLTPGKHFDLGIIIGVPGTSLKRSVYVNDVLKEVFLSSATGAGTFGVQRYTIEQSGWSEDRIDVVLISDTTEISETITINVDEECSDQDFYLTWLNRFGVFDYWNFKSRKNYGVNVTGSRVEIKNIFPNWPASGGEFADTIRRQTSREGRETINLESQYITLENLTAIKDILTSPLVQYVTSKYDRRTVILNADSAQLYRDKDDLFTIRFSLSYTDDIPTQSL